jgi:hypothetical protein
LRLHSYTYPTCGLELIMPKRLASPLLALAALAAVVCLSGCYERVVSARGLGAERIQTEEPYQQDSTVDRWFYGEKEEKPR